MLTQTWGLCYEGNGVWLILVVITSAEPSWLRLGLEKGGSGTYPWYCIQLTHERVELWVEAGGHNSW